MLKKATTVSELASAFAPAPLTLEDLKDFYVDVDCERDGFLSRREEIKKKLEGTDYIKILFAGHRGSGKSTELIKLKKEIEDNSFIVSFSIMEELDINDIEYIDLIMVMMEKLADRGEAEGLIPNNGRYLETIKNWLTDVTKIKAEETGYMMEVGAGIQANRGVLSLLIGLIAEFKASIRASSVNKVEYRKVLDKSITILKANCNILINEISMALRNKGKKLLLIIEDMDKGDIAKVQNIFFNHSGILSELNTRMIFTMSISTLTSTSRGEIKGRFDLATLPMLKVKEESGADFDKGIQAIRKIVEKRADLSLFESGILNNMIVRSGGVLRDLFGMIEIAGTSAGFNRLSAVNGQSADYAFNRLKSKYLGTISIGDEKEAGITTDGLYTKLVEVCNAREKKFPLDKTMLILLSCLAVLEYNGKQWFDIHPAVKALLHEMGKIPAEKEETRS